MKKFSLTLFGAGEVVNTTVSASEGNDLSAEMKTFYDKALIELATPNLVHDQFGQKRSIPKNGGKSVEFRCFSTLPKATKALTEGVTPSGSKLNVKAIVCSPEQYGDYIELSDVFELTSVDNTVVEATRKLADQAGRTLDTIVRNELNGGTNVMYCPIIDSEGDETEVYSRNDLTYNSTLTVKQVYKAAAELKAMNAPKIDGYYVGIIHPYVAYDLMQDAGDRWQNVGEYATPEGRFVGEIGMVGGVRFVETSEAKIYGFNAIGDETSLSVYGSGNGYISIYGDYETMEFAEPIDATLHRGMDEYAIRITSIGSGDGSGYSKVYLESPCAGVAEEGDSISINGGTSDGCSVFSTLILGADAYGVTELEGGIENIVKQKGYGNDPLNQRSSVGWKAMKCAKRLVEEYMIRVESTSKFAPSAKGN